LAFISIAAPGGNLILLQGKGFQTKVRWFLLARNWLLKYLGWLPTKEEDISTFYNWYFKS
jgi:hypothetical protein